MATLNGAYFFFPKGLIGIVLLLVLGYVIIRVRETVISYRVKLAGKPVPTPVVSRSVGTLIFSVLVMMGTLAGAVGVTWAYQNRVMPALGMKEIRGKITEDATWKESGGPYLVYEATVPQGVTLTIADGTVVKFAESGKLHVEGSLAVEGKNGSPVYFTSVKDDTVGGDINFDGDRTSPAPGDWGSIDFVDRSTGTISFAILKFGGGPMANGSSPGILFNYGNLTVADSVCSYSAAWCLAAMGGSLQVERSVFESVSNAILAFGGQIKVSDSSFRGVRHGIFGSSADVDARQNWWGDKAGPDVRGNASETSGARISDEDAAYDPWLTQDPLRGSQALSVAAIAGQFWVFALVTAVLALVLAGSTWILSSVRAARREARGGKGRQEDWALAIWLAVATIGMAFLAVALALAIGRFWESEPAHPASGKQTAAGQESGSGPDICSQFDFVQGSFGLVRPEGNKEACVKAGCRPIDVALYNEPGVVDEENRIYACTAEGEEVTEQRVDEAIERLNYRPRKEEYFKRKF